MQSGSRRGCDPRGEALVFASQVSNLTTVEQTRCSWGRFSDVLAPR
jgi:hypothetical protein